MGDAVAVTVLVMNGVRMSQSRSLFQDLWHTQIRIINSQCREYRRDRILYHQQKIVKKNVTTVGIDSIVCNYKMNLCYLIFKVIKGSDKSCNCCLGI